VVNELVSTPSILREGVGGELVFVVMANLIKQTVRDLISFGVNSPQLAAES